VKAPIVRVFRDAHAAYGEWLFWQEHGGDAEGQPEGQAEGEEDVQMEGEAGGEEEEPHVEDQLVEPTVVEPAADTEDPGDNQAPAAKPKRIVAKRRQDNAVPLMSIPTQAGIDQFFGKVAGDGGRPSSSAEPASPLRRLTQEMMDLKNLLMPKGPDMITVELSDHALQAFKYDDEALRNKFPLAKDSRPPG
jgi:hypothetical protein